MAVILVAVTPKSQKKKAVFSEYSGPSAVVPKGLPYNKNLNQCLTKNHFYEEILMDAVLGNGCDVRFLCPADNRRA